MARTPAFDAYLLLSPAILTVLITLFGCLGLLIAVSLGTQNYLDFQLGWSLQNYVQFLTSHTSWKLMLRSTSISALVTLASVVLAYPVAYFLAFDITRNKLLWLVLFTLPSWVSYLLRILSWKLILGYKGVVNTALLDSGLVSHPLEFLLYNPTAVTIALTHAWAPFAILPIFVSLEKFDRSLLQSAGDLGDSAFWTFLRVTLPLSMPGVAAAALLIFIPTFGDYVTPQLIGGPSGVMIGMFVTMQFGASNNWPLGAAASIVAMLVATLLALLFLGGSQRILKAIR